MTIAKVQHYVPQFLLRNFGNGKKDQVWVYDKTTDRSFPTNTKNVASESRFYDFEVDGEPNSLEPWLGRLESQAQQIVTALLNADSIGGPVWAGSAWTASPLWQSWTYVENATTVRASLRTSPHASQLDISSLPAATQVLPDPMTDTAHKQRHWNLRVIEFDAGEDSYSAVHEVYYDADGSLLGYAENPAVVMWTADDEPGAPQRALERLQRALSEPPINVKEFE